MLELSLKRLAILLDCAVVLKTQFALGWPANPPASSSSRPPSFGILLPWPGRDLCAYAKHTVCLKTRGGKRIRPVLGLALHSFALQDMRRVAPAPVPPSTPAFSLPALLYCLAVQVFACFGIFPTRFCLFSKLKLI